MALYINTFSLYLCYFLRLDNPKWRIRFSSLCHSHRIFLSMMVISHHRKAARGQLTTFLRRRCFMYAMLSLVVATEFNSCNVQYHARLHYIDATPNNCTRMSLYRQCVLVLLIFVSPKNGIFRGQPSGEEREAEKKSAARSHWTLNLLKMRSCHSPSLAFSFLFFPTSQVLLHLLNLLLYNQEGSITHFLRPLSLRTDASNPCISFLWVHPFIFFHISEYWEGARLERRVPSSWDLHLSNFRALSRSASSCLTPPTFLWANALSQQGRISRAFQEYVHHYGCHADTVDAVTLSHESPPGEKGRCNLFPIENFPKP